MKRVSHYLIKYILGVSACLLASCHHDHHKPDPQIAERTVIVYMMAENSLSSFSKSDINEMVAASGVIPEDVNYIIYKDAAINSSDKSEALPVIYRLSAKKGLQTWYSFHDDHDSCDSLTMLSTLRRIIDAFPARHYGLVFWSHASGWIPRRKTLGVDNGKNSTNSNAGSEMEITALRWTLDQIPHTDYIFFDACFMQDIEVAYELREVTDWIVGSSAEIPAPGAPYDLLMPSLCQGDAVGITETYHGYYPSTVWSYEVVLSAIRTDHLDALAEATHRFIPSLYSGRADVSQYRFQRYCSDYSNFTYCFDMAKTMHCLLSAEEYEEWYQAFEEAVPCHPLTQSWYANRCLDPRVIDPEHCGSVSMYVPSSYDATVGWNDALHKMQWYRAAGWDLTGW